MSLRPALLAVLVGLLLHSSILATEIGYFGVDIKYSEAPGAEEGRIEITDVVADGPAARAGLQKGDVITRFNGVSFRFRDWAKVLNEGGPLSWTKPGDKVLFGLLRGGEPHDIEVVAGELPAAARERLQRYRETRQKTRALEVLDRLASQKARIKIERPAKAADVRVVASDLSTDDLDALAVYFNTTRLRLFFEPIAEGTSAILILGQRPDSGDVTFELAKD